MAAIGREKTFAAAAAAAAAAADDDDDAAGAEEKTAQRRWGSLADAGRRIDFTAVFFSCFVVAGLRHGKLDRYLLIQSSAFDDTVRSDDVMGGLHVGLE